MSKQTILIVEDEAGIRFGLEFLQDDGYQLLFARSLNEGLHMLAENTVDLVLLDLGLGDGPGTALLNRIWQTRANMPVVVYSASGSMKTAALKMGATAFLCKPSDPETLRRTVAKALTTQEAETKG
jgi:DNA-binding NtrC family response regulator